MKRAVLADTGPLYASADPDDAHHQRAQKELNRLVREKYEIIVSYSTLLEAYSLILFRLGNRFATGWLQEMTHASLLNPNPDDYRRAMATAQGFSDQTVTLFDALTAAMALRIGISVWTYDHHFDVMHIPIWR